MWRSTGTALILLAAVTAPVAACNAILGTESGLGTSDEGGTDSDEASTSSGNSNEAGTSGDEAGSSGSEAGAGDSAIAPAPASCEPPLSDCLDPSRDDVIEVPTERTMTQALAEAKANDTIQLRKGTTTGLIKVPPLVTFRGCDGAALREDGTITFVGSGGTVEGIDVYGQIVANQTGTYLVHGVHCLARSSDAGTSPAECISGRSIDALVGATVDLTVERSWFDGRTTGISSATSYDTLTHEVKLTATNNVFRDVGTPIVVSEGGLVGKITAAIAFNTFIRFGSAVSLYSMSTTTLLRGNLFAGGNRAVDTDSLYSFEYAAGVDITQVSTAEPIAGTLLALDPVLDADAIPAATSLVVDAVTTPSASDPTFDVRGCPRPRAARTNASIADIGAVER